MASASRIAELASTISTHTALVDSYLLSSGKPQPSFSVSGPAAFDLPPELEISRSIVLNATQELNDLLQGPRDLLFNHHHNQQTYLQAISRFKIAQHVPLEGEVAFSQLGEAVGVDAGALMRILRFGIANRIFLEPRPGFIAHSAASAQIASDAHLADWLRCSVEEMAPAAAGVVDALVKWPQAEEVNQTGFSVANNTDLPFYAELAKYPERARRFGGAMSFFTTGEGFALQHLVDGFAWDSIGGGTVVDVGGSHGDAAFSLARKYPDLNLIVQELPEVVANSKNDTGLKVEFMIHDFFQPQPVKDADVYIFRWILHNWADKYARDILKALVPALKPGAKVLVMDMVMPPPGVVPNDVERKLRAMDLTMMEIGNAKERALDEWEDVFTTADPRFKLQTVKQPPGSRLSILEFTLQDQVV